MDWNPAEIKNAIDLELIGTEGEFKPTHKGIAIDRLVENAPYAAETITRLALYSENEGTRLKAAAYILDRVFGKVSDTGFAEETAKKDALSKFEEVIVPISSDNS